MPSVAGKGRAERGGRDRAPGYDASDAILLKRKEKNGAVAPTLAIRGEARLGRGVPTKRSRNEKVGGVNRRRGIAQGEGRCRLADRHATSMRRFRWRDIQSNHAGLQ
jgi:hypothetical protein